MRDAGIGIQAAAVVSVTTSDYDVRRFDARTMAKSDGLATGGRPMDSAHKGRANA